MSFEICSKEKCTGCGACENVCPQKSIKMKPFDEIGHIYPVIDETSCVKCGVCKGVCPQNKTVQLESPKIVYAGWDLDNKEHNLSSSGGLANYLSKCFVKENGIVYGCSSDYKEGMICHDRCINVLQVEKLRGSKYVQSCIGHSYRQCETDLKEGREVLFIGLPCQIGGLRAFLGKVYENLTTIDLVCHGVAPQKLLKDNLSKFGQKDGLTISFRGNQGMCLVVKQDTKELYAAKIFDDLFYIGFMSGLFFRESCYACNYSTKTRIGDITLADFWGVDSKEMPKEKSLGISLILVNTKKGEEILSKYGEGLYLEQRALQEACAGNANLRHPSVKNKNVDKFKILYSKKGFKRAAKKCLKRDIFKYKLLKLAEKIKIIGCIVKRFKGKQN